MDPFTRQLEESGWPQFYQEKLITGNLKSNVALATLWTERHQIAQELETDQLALIGQYYDKRNALEPFVRNCLANPRIRYIILIGEDRAYSKQVLKTFFEQGLDETRTVPGTETELPEEIPLDAIESLRNHVELIDLTDTINTLETFRSNKEYLQDTISSLESKSPYDEPRQFAVKEKPISTLPSEQTGFVVRDRKIADTWLRVLDQVSKYGRETKMKANDSFQVKEILNLTAVIHEENPAKPYVPAYLGISEQYVFEYYDEICSAGIDSGVLYTYGSIMRTWEDRESGTKIDQVKDLIDYLNQDIYRRSAVISTWRVEDSLMKRIEKKDKNNPCLITVQVIVQEDTLYMTAYFRSHDIFRAWHVNAFGLRNLQKIIAEGTGISLGPLVLHSASAHVYEENWEDMEKVLQKEFENTNCFYDPRGYFTISVKNEEIHATHFSPQSEELRTYKGKTAREVNDQINTSAPPSDSYHAAYLGEEMMKAEIALRLGVSYTQDAELELDPQ